LFIFPFFVFRSCFVASWKEHSKRHILPTTTTTTATTTNNNNTSVSTTEASAATAIATTFISSPIEPGFISPPPTDELLLVEDGKVMLNTLKTQSSIKEEEEWYRISDEKTYMPIADDIGRRLRIDITAYLVADNTPVAESIAIFTEPVLSMPKKSTLKRSLQTVPHERTTVAGSIRFRIVSYNILAEKYATKQVCYFKV
jgi:hypothetical protein